MYFSFFLWASTSAAIQPGLSSSNVLCFIAIVAIVSFEQRNHCIIVSLTTDPTWPLGLRAGEWVTLTDQAVERCEQQVHARSCKLRLMS